MALQQTHWRPCGRKPNLWLAPGQRAVFFPPKIANAHRQVPSFEGMRVQRRVVIMMAYIPQKDCAFRHIAKSAGLF
jgi:hypothetical protein